MDKLFEWLYGFLIFSVKAVVLFGVGALGGRLSARMKEITTGTDIKKHCLTSGLCFSASYFGVGEDPDIAIWLKVLILYFSTVFSICIIGGCFQLFNYWQENSVSIMLKIISIFNRWKKGD